jgi:GntR family transcriptional regulator/MocR family aminotransferase
VSLKETSQPVELFVRIERGGGTTLGAQIEDQLRTGVRTGVLRHGTQLPSTRDLARQLGVSRRIVVEAYTQLAAEGYLDVRQGARPRVAATALVEARPSFHSRPSERPRYDFQPSRPDLSAFPRHAWLRSLRRALSEMTDEDLGYGDPRGVEALRDALASYLGRVRGVVADPDDIVITAGFTQGLNVVLRTLASRGATRIALEAPGNREYVTIVERTGLGPVPIEVDTLGLRADLLAGSDADAVVVTPAHQHPAGVVLSRERRAELLGWLRERDAVAVEDDYDAEYRYERSPVGALQGLAPDRIVYAGSASKTLAPGVRLGWLVAPTWLVDDLAQEKHLSDRGTSRIEQRALADFIERGEHDRHLRRMRAVYRSRRNTLVAALEEALPGSAIHGVAAGLHVNIVLPSGHSEQAIRREATARRIAFETLADYRADAPDEPATLMLGYAQMSESALRAGVAELAAAIAVAAE